MSQETKDIASTVKEATQEVEDHLKETKDVVDNIQSKFYRNMIIGQLAVTAIVTTLLIVDKNRKSRDK